MGDPNESGGILNLQRAMSMFGTIDPCALVGLYGDDTKTVTIDGEAFTPEQLEAIAFLLRHSPDTIRKLR